MQRNQKAPVNVVFVHGSGYVAQAHPNRGQHMIVKACIRIHWEMCDFKEGIITEWM